MKPDQPLTINMPTLTPQAAYALLEWLECLIDDVGFIYCDEIRSEIQRQEYEEEEMRKELQEIDGEFDDPIPF